MMPLAWSEHGAITHTSIRQMDKNTWSQGHIPEDACQNHCQIEVIGLHYKEIKLNAWVLAAPRA